MAIVKATGMRVYINTGTVGTPVYTDLGCETDSTLTFNTDTIDTTCKDSASTKEHIVGDTSYSISFSGYANEGDTAIDRVITDQMARNQMMFEYKIYNLNKYSGIGTITSFELSGAHDGVISFSGTIEVDGGLTEAVA